MFDSYVNPEVKIDNSILDEYRLIEDINANKRIVILGTAGTGKSMLMRYLWVCYLVNPGEKIPIFIELRKYDSSNINAFLNFLLYTIVDSASIEYEPDLRGLIEAGAFTFIFDGFDELADRSKPEVERSILEYAKFDNRVVISSRHSDLFRSWQHFHVYTVQPFSLEKSVEVVNKIDFDAGAKKKFVRELKRHLYKQHKSFASRPLLLSMMLLTYRYYADVPDKMHLFYEQAFETLCTRHDIGKEMYKREPKTGYSVDLFKRYLGLFCLITYNNGAIELSTTALFDALDKVERISGEDIQKQAFVADLLDWVCVLQKDGLQISFTHRSFQEYFASLCMLSLPDAQVGEFLGKFACRDGDNVLNMIYDMNPDLVRRCFLEPTLSKYSDIFSSTPDFDVMTYINAAQLKISIDVGPRSFVLLMLRGTSATHSIRQASYALSFISVSKTRTFENIGGGYFLLRGKQASAFAQIVKSKEIDRETSDSILIGENRIQIRTYDRVKESLGILNASSELSQKIISWIESTELLEILKTEHASLAALGRNLAAARDEKTKSIDEIFSLPKG